MRVRGERRRSKDNRGGSMVFIGGWDWDGGNNNYTNEEESNDVEISSESRKLMAHHRLR